MIETRSDTPSERPYKIVRFILKDALTAGGHAAAYLSLCRSDGSFETTTKTVDVYDESNSRDGIAGDFGYAIFMPDSNHYEILDKVC